MNDKLLIVYGTRPEFIKLAPVVARFEELGFRKSLIIVNVGQHSDLIGQSKSVFSFSDDYQLNIGSGQNMVHQISQGLIKLQEIIALEKGIGFVLVQGDTNSALMGSLLAFYNKIKLAHVEAGLRTGNLNHPFPEEFNRSVTGIIADIHFAPSVKIKTHLISTGIPEKKILVTGNTVVDTLRVNCKTFFKQFTAKKGDKDTILVTLHRRENLTPKQIAKFLQLLKKVKDVYPDKRILWPIHPSLKSIITPDAFKSVSKSLEICAPLNYTQFIRKYKNTFLVLTDSGGVQEEAAALGISMVVYRETTERAEIMCDESDVVISRDSRKILSSLKSFKFTNEPFTSYGIGFASHKIVDWFINQYQNYTTVNTVIVGGGPAGAGVLVNAINNDKFKKLCAKGLAIVNNAGVLGVGNLPSFNLNSDTFAGVFFESLTEKLEQSLLLEPRAKIIKEYKPYFKGSVPLPLIKKYLNYIGKHLEMKLYSTPGVNVWSNTKVKKIVVLGNNNFKVYLDSGLTPLYCHNLVIAGGGRPHNLSNKREALAFNFVDLGRYSNKIISSDSLIKGECDYKLTSLSGNKKIIIVGGNHSALSSVWYFIKKMGMNTLPIEIWTEQLPKVFFNTKEEALKHGYTDFSDNEICKKTGRVYRFSGLRMDGRKLYMEISGIGKKSSISNVKINIFKDPKELEVSLSNAYLVIDARGYIYNLPEITDSSGKALKLFGETTKHWVDRNCTLLDKNSVPIKGLFGVGLASGFIPNPKMGGEKGFNGQTNGYWMYQHDIGDLILKQLVK